MMGLREALLLSHIGRVALPRYGLAAPAQTSPLQAQAQSFRSLWQAGLFLVSTPFLSINLSHPIQMFSKVLLV